MNGRIAKKRYKKAISYMQHNRKNGVSVMIINDAIVDSNGKECSWDAPGARKIRLKRPRIRYYRKKHTQPK